MNDEEVKVLLAKRECELRIQHLNFEKDRLRRRYQQSMKEINAHKKNCEDSLRKFTEASDVD